MKVRIKDICTSCGLCLDTWPDICEIGSDDIVQVTVNDEAPPKFEEIAQQTADECPVDAIIIERLQKLAPKCIGSNKYDR
ncbi:MAG: ferredoxin [Planctomycetota bacterium]|jgi:ferredoxin